MFQECHGHIILSGRDFTQCIGEHKDRVLTDVIDARLERYAASGVTFFRDGGDNMGASLYAKTAAGRYGIDYRTPAFAIHKAGCYGKSLGRSFVGIPALLALIDTAAENGADFIKLMVTGIMDFHTAGALTPGALSGEELSAAASRAHALGLSVMAHCNGPENILRALRCGCDSIEHGYYIDDRCLALLKETGAVWVPTVAPVANLIGADGFERSVMEKIVTDHFCMISRAAEMGCAVAPGSDCGSGEVFPGTGTQQEYDYLLKNTSLTREALDRGAAEIARRFQRR